jgi:hypothetical protein
MFLNTELKRLLILIASFLLFFSDGEGKPQTRYFVPLRPTSQDPMSANALTIRVLQYNCLADGLSGLRKDLGLFARATKEMLAWDNRKFKLLEQMMEHDPDVITCQEVDHYHDFFLPKLLERGYQGLFAPKPISQCLEVSDSCDGCAIFIKTSKLRVVCSETSTLVLPKIPDSIELDEIDDEDMYIRAQNQVTLMACLEFVGESATRKGEYGTPPPPLIVGTTHLKSSKSGTGERYRQREVKMILDRIDQMRRSYTRQGREPCVVFSGCLNALPEQASYTAPLCYQAIKRHRVGLRSIYTDDMSRMKTRGPEQQQELYSTWKARLLPSTALHFNGINMGRGEGLYRESISKSLIDYICYNYRRSSRLTASANLGVAFSASIPIPTEAPQLASMSIVFLLRSVLYLVASVITVTSTILSGLTGEEKAAVSSAVILGLIIFELTSLQAYIPEEVKEFPFSNSISDPIDETEKPSKVHNRNRDDNHNSGNGIDYRRGPALVGISALNIPSPIDIGPCLLPNENYPSDHICLGADLILVW